VTPEQAMLAQPAAALLPEDFVIGPLADQLNGSRAERLARATAARFMAGLAAGKAPGAEILPEQREELARSLQYYLDRKLLPARYRLGPFVELEDGSLRCRVRLFAGGVAGSAPGGRPDNSLGNSPGSAPGSASGELYFSKAEDSWYVADAQVGLLSLGAAPPPRRQKFVPSEVR
jgi:hypothetical protein